MYVIILIQITLRTIILAQVFVNVIFNLILHIGIFFEFVEIKLKTLNEELLALDQEVMNCQRQQNEILIIIRLKEIVDHHNQAIDFVRQIDSVLSPIMLFTYLINTFTFCFISFNLMVGLLRGESLSIYY